MLCPIHLQTWPRRHGLLTLWPPCTLACSCGCASQSVARTAFRATFMQDASPNTFCDGLSPPVERCDLSHALQHRAHRLAPGCVPLALPLLWSKRGMQRGWYRRHVWGPQMCDYASARCAVCVTAWSSGHALAITWLSILYTLAGPCNTLFNNAVALVAVCCDLHYTCAGMRTACTLLAAASPSNALFESLALAQDPIRRRLSHVNQNC